MWIRPFLIICMPIVLMGAGAAPPAPEGPLVVHEWGTFLSMSGSDGAVLDGMYHEEHALPGFVHARSRDQLRLPSVRLKGETPVIYFYSPRPRGVHVTVDFPQGIWTQWYPQALRLSPQLAQPASAADPRRGQIAWTATLIPPAAGTPAPAVPRTATDALWNFARDVDACYVQTTDRTKPGNPAETERFLFYRGLGTATLPLRVDAGTLGLDSSGPKGIRHVYMIRIEGGRGVFTYRPAIAPGERVAAAIPSMSAARPLDELVPALAAHLAARLVESGLYPKEAAAMVNTWRTSYFRTEGVRALFVMPQAWTDAFIPLRVVPPPTEQVRVMVGRLELLTPGREQRAEAAVEDLGAADSATRRRGFDFLRSQGRYVEPIVRRVVRTTRDERVRALGKRLLAADFVTELRAAIHASDGSRFVEDPVHVRAQLAVLLRELGQDEDAKAEATAVLNALAARPVPPSTSDRARHYLRARARAHEAAGDVAGEARWYESFVRFGSQVAAVEACRSCHQEAGPRELGFFRDWWAGAKYARANARLGRLDVAIAEQESTLAGHPDDPAARMLLGYLYAEKGQPARSAAAWDRLISPPRLGMNEAGRR